MRFLLIFLFAGLLYAGCTNPVENVTINVSGNVIHYKTTIILSDPAGAALPAFTVKITGRDSLHIYDYSGLKDIRATNGVITLGVHPDFEPTSSKDVEFNVVVSATGYETRIIPVTIAAAQYSQVTNVAVLKTAATSTSAAVIAKTTVLTAGKLVLADVLATAATTTITEKTTVTLTAGTQFKGATGALINGTPLIETIVHYNAKSAALLSLFPGASYSSTNVTGQNGTVSEAFFIPAAFANVDMNVAGQDVSALSVAFKVSQEINPDFKPQATGQKVKVGDQLKVYSYNYTSGGWKYETVAPVALDASGKLAVTFNTLSPNGFFVGDVLQTMACKNTSFKFIAPWLGTGTQPMNLEIWSADGLTKLSVEQLQVSDGLQQLITDLPSVAITYKLTSNANVILAQGNITDPCLGNTVNVTVAAPTGTVDNITLTLTATCPGKGSITPPDFDLFYKLSSSTGSFQLLGTVHGGVLKTTLLKIGSVYDFRVNWGAETTTIKSRTIVANDATTSGGKGQALSVQACGVN